MSKLLNVAMMTLAVNFLAAAAGIGWLWYAGNLDRDRVKAIKEIVFAKSAEPVPATQPAPDPTTQPVLRLEELLAKAAGRSASEQVQFLQHSFDAQMAILDRRQRELNDLHRQVELAKQEMSRDRASLDARDKELQEREQQATRLASDKGFQDSLALYNTMPAKQVKTVFMGLNDQTVMNYLQAMEPRSAARIIKEFKSPEETERIQKILEGMRQAQASATP